MCPGPERPEGPGRTGPSGTGGMEHRMARTPLGDLVSTPSRDPETSSTKIFFGAPGYGRLMERSSDKHAPRVDDELKHELRSIVQGSPVEARADEAPEQEG